MVSLSFWKFGETPYAKSIVIPFLLVGVFYASVGGFLFVSNPKRIVEYREAYQNDPAQFVRSEKERTDNFISWYPKTLWVFVVLGTLAMIGYGLTPKALPNSISLAVILLCFSGFMVDHFSKERAFVYSDHIERELKQLGQ
jgi:hypothetical protein